MRCFELLASAGAVRLTAANDSWTPAFLHKDHLGSVRAISGPDGTPEERTLYRPYGAQSEVVTATLSDDKSGLGERYDAGAGLQYLNARYYDPELAMFLQPDWFEVMQPGVGTNRYAYANGDPINRLDPGGNSTLGSTLSDFFESLFSGLGLGGNHSSADAAENASKVGQGIADSTINHPVVHDIAITLGVVAGVTAGVTAVVAAAELAAVATPTAYMLGLEIGTAEATGMTLGAGVVTKGVSELADDALAIATRSASASTASKAASAADEAAGAIVTVRTTRQGETAIQKVYLDGRKVDISPRRVKEWEPNTHPSAPAGSMQKVRYPNSLPGTKGLKRAPTAEELEELRRYLRGD